MKQMKQNFKHDEVYLLSVDVSDTTVPILSFPPVQLSVYLAVVKYSSVILFPFSKPEVILWFILSYII